MLHSTSGRPAAIPNRFSIATALIVVAVSAACSDDMIQPNRPPVSVGTIPTQTLAPGETATLDVSGYFSDPDGDPLTYSGESTDPSLATVSMSGSTLTISASVAGIPSVIVTATDPDGFFTAQSANVWVRPPNLPPVTVGSVPAVRVNSGSPVDVDLSAYFSDPDGDSLAYTATSSDTSIATVTVSGSTITIIAVASGMSSVAATATDPEGPSATQEIDVEAAVSAGFRDDFDSLDRQSWTIADANTEISDSLLLLTNTVAGTPGKADRSLAETLINWQVDVRLGRLHDNAVARTVFETGFEAVPFIAVELGSGVKVQDEDTNFRFLIRRPGDGNTWDIVAFAASDAVRDSVGQFNHLSVAIKQNLLSMVVGTDTVHAEFLQGAPPQMLQLRGVGLWVVPLEEASDRTALFDWIEVTGDALAGDQKTERERPGAGHPDPADRGRGAGRGLGGLIGG